MPALINSMLCYTYIYIILLLLYICTIHYTLLPTTDTSSIGQFRRLPIPSESCLRGYYLPLCSEARGGQLHQLGAHTGADYLLLPLLL